MAGMDTLSDREFEFLSKQFFMHIEKINKLHEERSALMRYSVIATFGYFGWLFLHPNIFASYSGSVWLLAPMWFVPFGFNCFGAWRNAYFMQTIKKHGNYFDFLLVEGMSCRNFFREYLSKAKKNRELPHPSSVFWIAILLVSLVTALYGITAEQHTEAQGAKGLQGVLQ